MSKKFEERRGALYAMWPHRFRPPEAKLHFSPGFLCNNKGKIETTQVFLRDLVQYQLIVYVYMEYYTYMYCVD